MSDARSRQDSVAVSPAEAVPAAAETGPDPPFDTAMRAELDRRIAALGTVDESTFGTIGRGEWILTILVSVILPLVCVWVFR